MADSNILNNFEYDRAFIVTYIRFKDYCIRLI